MSPKYSLYHFPPSSMGSRKGVRYYLLVLLVALGSSYMRISIPPCSYSSLYLFPTHYSSLAAVSCPPLVVFSFISHLSFTGWVIQYLPHICILPQTPESAEVCYMKSSRWVVRGASLLPTVPLQSITFLSPQASFYLFIMMPNIKVIEGKL